MRTIIRDNYTPQPGDYHDMYVFDEAKGKSWRFDCDGVFYETTIENELGDSTTTAASQALVSGISGGIDEKIAEAVEAEAAIRKEADETLAGDIADEIGNRISADNALGGMIEDEKIARQTADNNLQQQIDTITASSDVTDIVGTYADLQNYDTSTLSNNDIIKVLQDESRNDETTYYRWNSTTQQFTLIGEEGPYYTKSQTNTLLSGKQNTLTAGTGIDITNDVISATSAGPTVVQTPGTSTTDVMSQNATTSMIYADPDIRTKIRIGNNAGAAGGLENIVIGNNAVGSTNLQHGVVIGRRANAYSGDGAIVIGESAGSTSQSGGKGSVALGAYAQLTGNGIVNIGSSSTEYGYNTSKYRRLTGVYDGQSAHDAATVGQIKMGTLSATPTGTTVGFPGRLYTYDTGGGVYEVWLCVHDNGDNTYVWKQVSLI